MLKAQHTHDCDYCTLIGVYGRHDIYYCTTEGSVVGRESSEEAHYESLPMTTARSVASLSAKWEIWVALAEAYLAGREDGREGA